MSFVDLRFLIFFPTVVTLYLLLPQRFRWMLLLAASYIFYMAWKPEYGLLLFSITLIDFLAGHYIGKEENAVRRKMYLLISLTTNLSILFYFKYFNFVFSSIEQVLNFAGGDITLPVLNILLPLGISFHIFQSMSYTIDVYRRHTEVVTHFGKYALYVSFFPQLVAGPIERPGGLLKQIMEERKFEISKARSGTKLMAWGFFKKLVIADNIAPLVDSVYSDPTGFPGPSLAIATILFTYQIYCDFSGYTDIARGSARIFGYDLTLNFNRPFSATSMANFWRRWHMSLSSWLRDYLYHPLALSGKRHSRNRIYASLFITFVLIGLWHGANWNFVIFGALHGIYLTTGLYTLKWRQYLAKTIGDVLHISLFMPTFAKRLAVFMMFAFSLIFFRSQSLSEGLYIVSHLFRGVPEFLSSLVSTSGFAHVVAMNVPIYGTLIGILGIVFLEWIERTHSSGYLESRLSLIPRKWRFVIYGIAVFSILAVGSFGASQQFIYFQF